MAESQLVRPERMPRGIWILVAASFVIALGFGLIAPILPQFAQSFDVTIFLSSLVVSAFSFSRLVFAPNAGRLVNRFDFRTVYVSGLLIVATTTLLVAVAQNYWQLLLFRGLGGFGSTLFTVSAMGYIVRVAPPSMRGRASALYAGAFLLGNVFGPILGAAAGGLGLRWPFVIYAIGVYIAAAVVLFGIRPHRPQPGDDGGTGAPETPPRRTLNVTEALRDSAFRAALAGAFATGWLNFGVRVAIIPLFAAATFHRGGAVAGIALTAFALGNVLALSLAGPLSDRLGRRPLILGGLVVNGIFTAALGFMHSPVTLLVTSVLAGVGAGLLNSPQQAVVADVITSERAGGRVLAAFQMAQDLGAILGPLVVGAIADVAGYQVGFIVCGAVALAAAGMWAFGRETMPPRPALRRLDTGN